MEVAERHNYSPQEVSLFKFAPITTCDIERTFSRYKSLFAPNRHRFLFENLKMFLTVNCFYAN